MWEAEVLRCLRVCVWVIVVVGRRRWRWRRSWDRARRVVSGVDIVVWLV